jgi:hypothetical protein
MGGFGSGRYGGRPTADMSLRIDLAWMIRSRRAVPGTLMSGSLHWTCGGEPSGSIGYTADMRDTDCARLILDYTRGSGDRREHVRQDIRLTFTVPHYGGKRWWMICPYRHTRVGKLYLPNGGDRFASRQAWRLGYRCQRIASHDRASERLFRYQRKMGCEQGVDAFPRRPKGMWHRTWKRHRERLLDLNEAANAEFTAMAAKLMGRLYR